LGAVENTRQPEVHLAIGKPFGRKTRKTDVEQEAMANDAKMNTQCMWQTLEPN